MKFALATVTVILLAAAGAAGAADATAVGADDKPFITFTPYGGGAFFHEDFGLEDKAIFGARLGWQVLRKWRVEGNYGYTLPVRTRDGADVDINEYGLDLMYESRPGHRFNPYVLGGWAQFDYAAHAPDAKQHLNGWEWAMGVNWRLGGDNASNRSLRFELRDVMSKLGDRFANDGATTHNWIATVGLQLGFGKSSRDSDADGVRDRADACPDTPRGAVVDAAGCPRDSDGDGVYDGLDTCPDTPAGAVVDRSGCPLDGDGDGVYDGLDKCPGTPQGAMIDASGCPLDSDGDGVYDGLDKCPDTPKHLKVDAEGCPIPVTDTAIQLLDTGRISTSQIEFKISSAELERRDTAVLDEIAQTLADWPALRIEIGGHTDSSGSEAFNQKLSEQRAQSVLDYLLVKQPGLDRGRFTTKGYGEGTPLEDNGTVEGRAANRRVEFTVLNTDELRKKTETRKLLER
ncbi:MAG: OmpA family protein [Candidatus Krumholzibacteriia bacterium]